MIEECPICYNDDKLCTLVCDHKICSLCLNKVADINKKCPFCRIIVIYRCRICDICIPRKHYNRSQCKKCVKSLLYSYYIDIRNMLTKYNHIYFMYFILVVIILINLLTIVLNMIK